MKRELARACVAVVLLMPVVSVPAAQAAPAPPVITITYPTSAYDRGDATRTGAQFEPFGQLTAAQVGYGVNVNITVVDPSQPGAAFGTKILNWLGCRSIDAPSNACGFLSSSFLGPGELIVAGGDSYAPAVGAIGQYLRVDVEVRSAETGLSSKKSGTGNGQLLIWPAKANASGPPEWSRKMAPSSEATISLKAWTLAQGTAFQKRIVTVYSCPAATNGQSAAYAWNPAADGCVDVSQVLPNGVLGPGAKNLNFTVPAGTAGRYLVASDLMLATWGNGNVTGAVVRSVGAAVGTPVTPADSAAPADSTAPSADSSSSSSSSPAPSTPDADASAPSGAGVSAAIAARPSAKPGGGLKVVVSTSSAQSAGKATVSLKRSPKLKAPTVQVLKKVSIVNGTGQSVTKLRRTLSRGTYYVVAKFTDANSGATAVATKKVTVR